MKWKSVDNKFILKVEKGELVHHSLVQFCKDQGIKNASITGIGAVQHIKCGYYDLANKTYLFKECHDIVEVASYQGNIMIKEDDLFVHAHGTFSDPDNQVFGGHVDEMTVGVVMEIILTPLSSTIERTYDEAIGLYLMDI
jgi:predicted DNA-binding protein with PD1-like motif